MGKKTKSQAKQSQKSQANESEGQVHRMVRAPPDVRFVYQFAIPRDGTERVKRTYNVKFQKLIFTVLKDKKPYTKDTWRAIVDETTTDNPEGKEVMVYLCDCLSLYNAQNNFRLYVEKTEMAFLVKHLGETVKLGLVTKKHTEILQTNEVFLKIFVSSQLVKKAVSRKQQKQNEDLDDYVILLDKDVARAARITHEITGLPHNQLKNDASMVLHFLSHIFYFNMTHSHEVIYREGDAHANDLAASIAYVDNKVQDLERNQEKTQEDVKNLMNDIATIIQENNHMKNELKAANEKLKAMESEFKQERTQRKAIKELQEGQTTHGEELKKLRGDVGGMQTDMGRMQTEASATTALANKLQADLKGVVKDMDKMKTDIEKHQTKTDDIIIELQDTTSNLKTDLLTKAADEELKKIGGQYYILRTYVMQSVEDVMAKCKAVQEVGEDLKTQCEDVKIEAKQLTEQTEKLEEQVEKKEVPCHKFEQMVEFRDALQKLATDVEQMKGNEGKVGDLVTLHSNLSNQVVKARRLIDFIMSDATKTGAGDMPEDDDVKFFLDGTGIPIDVAKNPDADMHEEEIKIEEEIKTDWVNVSKTVFCTKEVFCITVALGIVGYWIISSGPFQVLSTGMVKWVAFGISAILFIDGLRNYENSK